MKYSAIIAAGGQGKRFGGNKLLAQLSNQEIVIYKTIKIFLADEDCQQVIIGCQKKLASLITKEFKNNLQIEFAPHGVTRFDTINNCLSIPIKTKTIMIHDGVRCFIKLENLTSLKKTFLNKHTQALIPTLPLSDAIKDISNNKIKTLDRNNLIAVQTPQMFERAIIIDAYHKHLDQQKIKTIYDDSQLIEEYVKNVKIEQIRGWEENRKITFKKDLS